MFDIFSIFQFKVFKDSSFDFLPASLKLKLFSEPEKSNVFDFVSVLEIW